MAMGDNDVSCLDESPLEIIVGLFAHASEAGLAAAGMDLGNDAGVGCEMAGRGEAIDGTDLASDDDGEDVTHTRDGLQTLHVG